MHLISPDQVAIGTIEIPRTERLCLSVIRVRDYSSSLSEAEKAYVNRVNEVRRNQYSSGRRAAELGLSFLSVNTAPYVVDERRPTWPQSIVGSIAHSNILAVALVGLKQDFRGVGIDILPTRGVSDKVRERILLDEELKVVSEGGDQDWQTMLFCAKESVYKATNPATDEFLGFKDVCVSMKKTGAKFSAITTTPKRSSRLVSSGLGYVGSVENHWLTLFLLPR
ncbi:MAG: 4'-phosphopantetheinyl transferase superfamily protein [Gammaproteobacteria bacterium]|nr:4'-phosphopantetheinyl transferase superfamily protein [Gammaproteobacteria bacterium]MYF38472.1 4'-phosphopantetheinyl transferase superfamily protein [Gammaproteobacteria bacterium]